MSSTPNTFRAFLVDESKQGSVTDLSLDDLPPGEVVIRASLSSLNYKDVLAAGGHPGVAKRLPHVPGIDVAGVVETSSDRRYRPGDEVFVTGYQLGSGCWGGWSQLVRVPADWVIAIPPHQSALRVMTLGTAGFTAAQCVAALERQSIGPEDGDIVVTGATGGVGSLAVAILAKLGYQVTVVTGKADQHERLLQWGAAKVLPREAIDTTSDKPLLSAVWKGAVDTVGGKVLAGVIKQLAHRGCVAACGNVAGNELALTVLPFILRGVKLEGIDSSQCPHPERLAIWDKLLGPWQPPALDSLAEVVPLSQVQDAVDRMRRGQTVGRVVIDLNK